MKKLLVLIMFFMCMVFAGAPVTDYSHDLGPPGVEMDFVVSLDGLALDATVIDAMTNEVPMYNLESLEQVSLNYVEHLCYVNYTQPIGRIEVVSLLSRYGSIDMILNSAGKITNNRYFCLHNTMYKQNQMFNGAIFNRHAGKTNLYV